MKSQKVNNRPPRPFAKQSSSRSWEGGGFIPGGPKPAPKKAQPKVKPSAETQSSSDETPPVISEE